MVVTRASFGGEERKKKSNEGGGNSSGTGREGHTPQIPIPGMPMMPQETGMMELGSPDAMMMEPRDQSGARGPHSGGPGAGSTKAKGLTAGLAPHDAGNDSGTGAQGSPPAVNPVSNTANPTTTGIGQGAVIKGGRGASYVK